MFGRLFGPREPASPVRHQIHTDAVMSLHCMGNADQVISAGRERVLKVTTRDGARIDSTALPFFPGPIAVGAPSERGAPVALGRFVREETDAINEPDIIVWEGGFASPRYRWTISGLHRVLRLAFRADANRLCALVSLYNKDGTERITALFAVVVFDLAEAAPPRTYPVPATGYISSDLDQVALSASGLYVACRTTYTDDRGTPLHGVGVWDVEAGAWKHRFGGREEQPHKIYALSRDGDTVFTAREDSPNRDFHVGGPEWYDGLYIWEKSSPPEGTEEAKPFAMHGSNMVFNADESRFADLRGDGGVDIFDVRTKTCVRDVRLTPSPQKSYGSHNAWCVAFTPDGKTLATGHVSGEVCWWSL